MRFPLLSICYQTSQSILSKMNKSTHAETVDLRGEDGVHLLHQLGLTLIRGQLQSVEAGVTLWVRIVLVYLYALDGELVYLVSVALQERKAQDWHPARSCHKMQQISQLLLVQRLHVPPKPYNLRVTNPITHIQGRSLPILNIDILRPIEQHLHLMRLKHRQQLQGKHTVDRLFDRLHIPLATLHAEVIHQQVDVLLLVGVCYHYLAAVWLQLHLLLFAVLTSEVGKGQLELFNVGTVEDMLPVCVHLSVVTVKIAELQLLTTDLPPYAASQETIQGDAVEQSLADHHAQQSAHFHSILILTFFFHLLYDESIGCLVSLAKFEQSWHLTVENILNAQMHPFPQHSARVIDYLPIQAYLHFFPKVDALKALVTGHDHILSVDLQPLAARLPTYPQLFHLDPQPRHFFLETKVFDNTSLIVAGLIGQQQHWLLGYRKFDFLVIGRDLDINELPLIFLELVAITSSHVCLVVSVLGVRPMRVMVNNWCVLQGRLEVGRRITLGLGLMIEVAI